MQNCGSEIINRGASYSRKTDRLSAVGLSTGHISPGFMEIWSGGSVVEVHRSKPNDLEQVGGGVRGKVKGFSKKSRLRLLKLIAKTEKKQIPLFMTCTYPDVFPEEWQRVKRDIDTLGKRIKRKFPNCGFIWRVEEKVRKTGKNAGEIAPHLHFLVWGVKYAHLRAFIPKAWFEIVGSGDRKHFRAGTRVSYVRSWRGVMSYASKYITKEEEYLATRMIGRRWGIVNKNSIPWAELFRFGITDKNAYQLFRLLYRYSGIKNRSRTYTVSRFVNNPDQWSRVLVT